MRKPQTKSPGQTRDGHTVFPYSLVSHKAFFERMPQHDRFQLAKLSTWRSRSEVVQRSCSEGKGHGGSQSLSHLLRSMHRMHMNLQGTLEND